MIKNVSNVAYKFGEIFLVRFHPSRGSEIGKYRPAFIVNENINDIDPRLVAICPFTTRKVKKLKYELRIKRKGALDKDSLALLWYIRTVDVDRLEAKLGELTNSQATQAKKLLADLWSQR